MKKNTPGALRFELRNDKINTKTAFASIRASYHLNSDRKKFSTGLMCSKYNWRGKDQDAYYYSPEAAKKQFPKISYKFFMSKQEVAALNAALMEYDSTFESSILNALKYAEEKSIPLNIDLISDEISNQQQTKIKGKSIYNPREIIYDYIKKYIEEKKYIRVEGSLKVYNTLSNHLRNFESLTGTKVKFANINSSFMSKFQTYLISLKKHIKNTGETIPLMNNITIDKQLSTLKTIIGYATEDAKIKVDESYKRYSVRKGDREVIRLTASEFNRLLSLKIENKTLDRARDLFCFHCFTGLRYIDWDFSRENIIQHNKNGVTTTSLRVHVKKVNKLVSIPLPPPALEILSKYKNEPSPLPRMVNQKINEYIKEIGKMAGIDEMIIDVIPYGNIDKEVRYPKWQGLSTHAARKSTINILRELNVSMQDIMAILGSTNLKVIMKHYNQVDDSVLYNNIITAWGKQSNNLKAV